MFVDAREFRDFRNTCATVDDGASTLWNILRITVSLLPSDTVQPTRAKSRLLQQMQLLSNRRALIRILEAGSLDEITPAQMRRARATIAVLQRYLPQMERKELLN